MRPLIVLAALSLLTGPAAAARVVSLGGDVTEIVFALGEGRQIVCDDQTSEHPTEARVIPQVGYLRTLAAEGVLSCKPELIIASEDAGPAAAVTQLKSAGVRYIEITNAHSTDGVIAKIGAIANALNVHAKGASLQASFRVALAAALKKVATYSDHPRAIFLMSQGPGGSMAAGKGTAADAILTLAGATNVGAGFNGYKPLTPEAAIALKPDVIVIADYAVKMLGGVEALRARPEIAVTPAGANGHIVSMDALLLLGFGPRTPQAIVELAAALHPAP